MAQLDDRKATLIAQLDRARSRIAAHRRELNEDLKVPGKLQAKVKSNFRRNRFAWLGATALIGLIIAKVPPRTKKVVVERRRKRDSEIAKVEKAGILMGILKFAFDLAKPFLLRFGKGLITQAMERRGMRADGGGYPSRI